MFYVYVIFSKENNKLYYGFTNDLKKRFEEHVSGKSFATKHTKDWKLVYYEAYLSKKDARYREKRLKKYGSTYGHLKNRIKFSISEV